MRIGVDVGGGGRRVVIGVGSGYRGAKMAAKTNEACFRYSPGKDGWECLRCGHKKDGHNGEGIVFEWIFPQIPDEVLPTHARLDLINDYKEHLYKMLRGEGGEVRVYPLPDIPQQEIDVYRWVDEQMIKLYGIRANGENADRE